MEIKLKSSAITLILGMILVIIGLFLEAIYGSSISLIFRRTSASWTGNPWRSMILPLIEVVAAELAATEW